MIHIIYRISDSGYAKVKPKYINNSQCLENAWRMFNPTFDPNIRWHIIADNVSSETEKMIPRVTRTGYFTLDKVSVGHGAGTFNLALDYALKLNSEDVVYFVENDYIHKPKSNKIIYEALNLGADYVTLYLHPDKFISPQNGGNPNVDSDGGYLTKMYRGESELFALFDSTTMTFAAKVKTLKDDEQTLRSFTLGTYPRDYEMFTALKQKGKALLCPLNSYSTHGESLYLAPFTDWSNI